jgi:hypothetical protein
MIDIAISIIIVKCVIDITVFPNKNGIYANKEANPTNIAIKNLFGLQQEKIIVKMSAIKKYRSCIRGSTKGTKIARNVIVKRKFLLVILDIYKQNEQIKITPNPYSGAIFSNILIS